MRCCNTSSRCLPWLQGTRSVVTATWIILGVLWNTCGVVRSQTVYTENFGTSTSNATLQSVGWDAWNGSAAAYCADLTSQMYIYRMYGGSDGPYFTAGAQGSPIGLATTMECGSIHTSLLQSISFQSNNKEAESEIRIAVKTADGWFVSDVLNGLNQGWGPVTTCVFSTDAANWSVLDLAPGATLSVGAAASSDLSGYISEVGFYVDAHPGGDVSTDYIMRVDNYTVTSLTSRFWDASGDSGVQAGSGTWDSGTTAMWSESTVGSNPLEGWTDADYNANFYASGTSEITVGSGVGANSLIFGGTGYTLSGQRVTVGAGGIVADESATISGGVTLGASQSVTVADGKTLAIGGTTTVPAGMVWTKNGGGTLTSGQITVGANAGYVHAAGTLNVGGNGVYVTAGDAGNAVFTQTGGTVNATGSWLIVGGDGGPTSGGGNAAVFNMEGGVLSASVLYAGWKSDTVVTQTGGTVDVNVLAVASDIGHSCYNLQGGSLDVATYARIGYKVGTTADVVQSGGSVSFGTNLLLGENGNASYTINTDDGGSSLSVGESLYLARYGSSTSALNVDGGTVSIDGNFSIAEGANTSGTVTQTGGTVTIAASGALQFGAGTGTYNLDGGTLQVASVLFADANKNLLCFGGGTLENNGTTPMTSGIPVEIEAGGGVIHTSGAGADIGLTGSITGVGDLTKTGTGVLTLSGTSESFAGGVTVDGGTLLVHGSLAATAGVTVASGATIGGTGTIGGPTSLSDGAMLAPGASIGTLTFGGDLTLAGGAVWNWEFVDDALGNYDQVVGQNGAKLILPTVGDAITLNILGEASGHSADLYDEFTIFVGEVENFDASLFDLVDNSNWTGGWRLSSDGQDLVLTAVPEPASLAPLVAGVLGLLASRRRRFGRSR